MPESKNRYQRYLDALLENRLVATIGILIAALALLFGITDASLKFRSSISGMALEIESVRIQEEASGSTALIVSIRNASDLPKTVRAANIKITSALTLEPCGQMPTSGATALKEYILRPEDVDKKILMDVNATIGPKSVGDIKLLFHSSVLDTLYNFAVEIDQTGSIGEFSFFFPDLFVSSLLPQARTPPYSAQYTPCQQSNARKFLVAPKSARENFHLVEARKKALRVPGATESSRESGNARIATVRPISEDEAEKSGVLLVYLTDGNDTAKSFHCNASLLSAQEGKVYVVTAAHCLVNRVTGEKYKDSQIVIKTPNGRVIPTASIVPFEYRPNSTDRDIAFIEVKR